MSSNAATVSDSGIWDREVIPHDDFRAYVREVRRHGGRIVRSAPCTIDGGTPAYAVTVFYA